MFLKVEVTRFVDHGFPGFVAFFMVDAHGCRHDFVDKVPVLWADEDMGPDSAYPLAARIACEGVDDPAKARGDGVRLVSTHPRGIDSTEGVTRFWVRPDQLEHAP